MPTSAGSIEPKKAKHETRETKLEAPRSPFELARQYVQDAHEQTIKTLSEIADAEAVANALHDRSAADRLEALAEEMTQEETTLKKRLHKETTSSENRKAAYELNEEERSNLWDLTAEEVGKVLAGEGANAAKLEALLKTPEGRQEAEGRIMEKIRDLTTQHPCSFENLERFFATLGIGQKYQELTMESLRSEVGTKVAERLRSKEYRKNLQELAGFLGSRMEGEKSPFVANPEQGDLRSVIGFYETLGSKQRVEQLIKAMDYRKNEEPPPTLAYKFPYLLNANDAVFDADSQDIRASIEVHMDYGAEQEASGQNTLTQTFVRDHIQASDGTWQPRKSTSLETMVFESKYQSKEIAKNCLRGTLEWILEGNDEATREGKPEERIESIRLWANIDKGGWYWALRGFGWDKEKMLAKYVPGASAETADGKKRSLPNEIYALSKDTSPEAQEKKFALMVEDFVRLRIKQWETFRKDLLQFSLSEGETEALKMTDAQLEEMLRYATSDDPRLREKVTPAGLAAIGASFAYHVTEPNRVRVTETQYQELRKTEEAEGLNPSKLEMSYDKKTKSLKPTRYTPGMDVMLGSKWYGIVETTTDGAQNGDNLRAYAKSLGVSLSSYEI